MGPYAPPRTPYVLLLRHAQELHMLLVNETQGGVKLLAVCRLTAPH